MRKTILLTATILSGACVSIIPLALTSCNKKEASTWDSHFEVATEEQKTKKLTDGSTTAKYTLKLINELEEGCTLEAKPTVTSKSAQDINITIGTVSVGEDKKTVSFDVTMTGTTNSEAKQFDASFDIEMTCKKEKQTVAWAGNLCAFKLDVTIPAKEEHTLSVKQTISINNVSLSLNKTSIVDDETFTISITNNRTKDLANASITFKIGENVVSSELLDIPVSTTSSTPVIYKRSEINNMLIEAGKPTLKDGDHIEVNIVRIGACQPTANNTLQSRDINGNWVDVADNDLANYEGRFLIKNATADGDYDLSDEDVSFAQYLSTHTGALDLYLIYGDYVPVASGYGVNATELKLHGILNSQGTKQATFVGYNVLNTSSLLYLGSVSFDLIENLNFQCRYSAETGVNNFYANGFQAATLNCKNCYFKGGFTLYCAGATFDHCTFDSSEVQYMEIEEQKEVYKNAYPMWIYSDSYGTFTDCDFIGAGKTVKIYSDTTDALTTTNTFTRCTFTLVIDKVPVEPVAAEVHNPVEIDSRTLSGSAWFTVILDSCTYSSNYAEKGITSIWIDKAGASAHSTVTVK